MDFRLLRRNKNAQAAIFLLAVVLAVSFGSRALLMRPSVPADFTATRQEGSEISGQIISLLSDSLKNLEKIRQADKDYNFGEALGLVRHELSNVIDVKIKAAELTRSLDKMARLVQDINPTQARNLALEAVSSEVSLISNLMIYNDTLNGLLETLKLKFSGSIRYDAKDVQVLIENLNKEATEINALNDLFNQKMREFDALVK